MGKVQQLNSRLDTYLMKISISDEYYWDDQIKEDEIGRGM